MPVTVYRSTDVGAPVLNGLAGSLVTVLDAVLVNGYNLADADVSKRRPGAGWTKAFTATNKAVYRNLATGTGVGDYFRVDDTGANTLALGQEARCRGYEAMTTVDVGTGLFPTAAQAANGIIVRKSDATDNAARPWLVIADNRTFYLLVKSGDYGSHWSLTIFGETYSVRPTNPLYRTMVAGRITEQTATAPSATAAQETAHLFSALTVAVAGHYMARSWSQFPQSAVAVGKHGNGAHSSSAMNGLIPYPNPVDDGLYLSPITVHEPISPHAVIRGRLRGMWHLLHPAGTQLADGDTVQGTGPNAAKTFLIVAPAADGVGILCFETSDTWETN